MGTPVRIVIASCIVVILLFLAAATFFPASLDMDSYNQPSSSAHPTGGKLPHSFGSGTLVPQGIGRTKVPLPTFIA